MLPALSQLLALTPMLLLCDRLFTGGFLFLILFTPFAFGAVHPWAYATMEVVIFALVIVWMAKLAAIRGRRSEVGGQWGGAGSSEQGSDRLTPHALPLTPVALPLALFIAFCAMQLMPLPPSFLQIISPQTFETYRQILPGWPERVPYAEVESMEQRAGNEVGGQKSEISDQRSKVGNEQGATSTEQIRTVRGEGLGVSGNVNNASNATNAERNNAINATNAKGQEQSATSGEQSGKSTGQTDSSPLALSTLQPEANAELQAPGSQLPALSSTPPSPSPPAPSSMLHAVSSLLLAPSSLLPPTWRPLSVSPLLSKIDLLKFAAFAALFLLVWRYPFAEPFENFEFRTSNSEFFILSPEQRFLRSAVFAVLVTGLLVAAVGFVERFTWNGKILWFFVPYDWGEAMPNGIPRASGPFVNPDHFANYLSLIFPLALGCALFRTFMVSKAQQYGCQIFCGFTAFLLFTGILLSLSRGGWISALLGVVILAWLAPWQRQRAKGKEHGAGSRAGARGRRSDVGGQTSEVGNPKFEIRNWKSVVRLSAITVCLLLIVSLFFVGSGGREQVDARLEETFVQDLGLAGRLDVWKDSVPMIRDFPVFGVGLGAWSELFTRYESGPWSTDYYNDAHNDYVELLAETGVVGFGLLAAFFVAVGRRLVHGIDRVSSKNVPLLAGILAALGGMALHSWLDFSLQIPANALLFTVLLALGLRLARGKEQGAGSSEQKTTQPPSFQAFAQPSITPQWSELGSQQIRNSQSAIRNSGSLLHACRSMLPGAVLAAALIACAVVQSDAEVKPVQSIAESKERLLSRPTKASYHLSLVRRVGDKAPLDWQLNEYQAALWIQPANPYVRDKYAATLIAMGKTDEGLKEISQSVARAPSLDEHDYLSAESLPLLSIEEQNAVEAGFRQALAWQYPLALNGLAEFYAKLDRHADQAALYEHAAQNESDRAKKTELLMNGGLAYLRAARATAPEVSGQKSEVGRQGAGSKEQGAEDKEQSAKSATTGKSKEQVRTVRGEGLGVRGNATNASNAINAINASGAPHASRVAPSSTLHAAAERLFREAIAASPTDVKAYHHLLTAIFAARKDLDGARDLVSKAIENGAPPLPLYLSFAEAAHKGGSEEERDAALKSAQAEAEKSIQNGGSPHTLYMTLAEGARSAGDRDREAAALLKALDIQPRSADTLARLANVYLQKQNYDRAALYLGRIAKIDPDSAQTYFQLAAAEEARYRFADAGRAYARALELAPKNANYRDRYEQFKARVERNRSTNSMEHGAGSTVQ